MRSEIVAIAGTLFHRNSDAMENNDISPATLKKKGLLKDQLEVLEEQGPDGRTRFTIKPLSEQLSFDKGFFVFIRALQALTRRSSGVIVVGLAGPSGSGKTAFSEKVHSFIPGSTVLSMDNYNDGNKVVDGNFDDPRLTDYDCLLKNLTDLKAGRSTEVPIYDFKESRRSGYRTVSEPTSKVLIVEGIYALSSRIRPLLDLRVSITGGVHFDLVKRVLRDISRSGQAPEEIIQQISDTVYPMYKAFIEPDLITAHLRIYNTFNPFSGFMNATYILKSAQQVSKAQIQAVLQPNHTTKTETETHDIYLLPPNEDPETCQSWLRMRNRDGRYNLMFEEWVTDGDFVISPRITFEVSVRILGGLMALGYTIGTIMRRTSVVYSDEKITVKVDDVEGMTCKFVQVQGKDRALVAEAGRKLGLDGTYIALSYIEQVQLERLTAAFQNVTDDLKRRFVVDGEPLIDESFVGTSPDIARSHFMRKRIEGFSPSTSAGPILGMGPLAGPSSSVAQQTPAGASQPIPWQGFPRPSLKPLTGLNGTPSAPIDVRSSAGSAPAPQNGLLSSQLRNGSGGRLPREPARGGSLGFQTGGPVQWDEMLTSGQSERDRVERMVAELREKVEHLAERELVSASRFEAQLQTMALQQKQLLNVLEGMGAALTRAPARDSPAPYSLAWALSVACPAAVLVASGLSIAALMGRRT